MKISEIPRVLVDDFPARQIVNRPTTEVAVSCMIGIDIHFWLDVDMALNQIRINRQFHYAYS